MGLDRAPVEFQKIFKTPNIIVIVKVGARNVCQLMEMTFLTIENSDPTYHNEEKLASKLIVVNLFASNAKTMPKTVIFLPFLAGWL